VPDCHAAHHPFCAHQVSFGGQRCRACEGRVSAASDAGRLLTASESQPDPIPTLPRPRARVPRRLPLQRRASKRAAARRFFLDRPHPRVGTLSPPRRGTPKSAPARPLFSRPAPDNLPSPQHAIRLCLTRPIRCTTLAAAVVHSLQPACLHPGIQHHRRSAPRPSTTTLEPRYGVPARNTYTHTPQGMGYRRPDTLPDCLVSHVAQRSRSAAD
jgi:hypothetical protein